MPPRATTSAFSAQAQYAEVIADPSGTDATSRFGGVTLYEPVARILFVGVRFFIGMHLHAPENTADQH